MISEPSQAERRTVVTETELHWILQNILKYTSDTLYSRAEKIVLSQII